MSDFSRPIRVIETQALVKYIAPLPDGRVLVEYGDKYSKSACYRLSELENVPDTSPIQAMLEVYENLDGFRLLSWSGHNLPTGPVYRVSRHKGILRFSDDDGFSILYQGNFNLDMHAPSRIIETQEPVQIVCISATSKKFTIRYEDGRMGSREYAREELENMPLPILTATVTVYVAENGTRFLSWDCDGARGRKVRISFESNRGFSMEEIIEEPS